MADPSRRRGARRGQGNSSAPTTPSTPSNPSTPHQSLIPTPRLRSSNVAIDVDGTTLQHYQSPVLHETNAPAVQLENPMVPNQYGTVSEVWNAIDRNDIDQVDRFLHEVQRVVDTLGQTASNVAFDAVALKESSPVMRDLLSRKKTAYQRLETLATKEKERRDRKAQAIRRLLERSQPRSTKFKALQEHFRKQQKTPPQDLGPWTSETFMNGLVIPYVGNSTTVMEAIIESRVETESYNLDPLELLQRASYNMVMRLGGRQGQRALEEYPTPTDIRNVSVYYSSYDNDRDKNLADSNLQQMLRFRQLQEIHSLYFKRGIPPRNFQNLVNSRGKPNVAVRAESYIQQQIYQGVMPGITKETPSNRGGSNPTRRQSGTGQRRITNVSRHDSSSEESSISSPKGSNSAPRGGQSTGRQSADGRSRSDSNAGSTGNNALAAAAVQAARDSPNRAPSRSPSYSPITNAPTPSQPLPPVISPLQHKSRAASVSAPKVPSPLSQRPVMGGAYQDQQGVWRTNNASGQETSAANITTTFMEAMNLDPPARPSNPSPLNPSAKRTQKSVTPVSGQATPSGRSPLYKKARPEKGVIETGIDNLKQQIGYSLSDFEKRHTPPPQNRSPYPNPIANPSVEQTFAWHLVKSYATAQQDEVRPPELSEDDVETMKTFGIKKMIAAYQDIAKAIPGRYQYSHQYLAEKGIMSRLREMERAINEKRGTMTTVYDALEDWMKVFGGMSQNIRGGNLYFGGTSIDYHDLQSMLFSGRFFNGRLKGNVIHAVIAAYRDPKEDDGVNVIPFHCWSGFLNGNSNRPEYWGDKSENLRLIVVHDNNHWFLMAVQGKQHRFVVLDSLYNRDSKTDKHIIALERFLEKGLGWPVAVRNYSRSNQQFNDHDCGVWVCMNAITLMRNGIEAIPNVTVDYYTRTEFIRQLHEAVLLEKGLKGSPFTSPPRRDPKPIPEGASVVSLEEEVQGVNAEKLVKSGI